MATFYGSAIASDYTTLDSIPGYADAGTASRVRVARFPITVLSGRNFASGDIIRMGTLRSGDRILDIRVGNEQFPASTTVDIGLYLTNGRFHDGAVVDADLFASALDLNTARTAALVSVFGENFATSTVGAHDAGKYLWQLADLGAATLTADPKVEYDLALTLTADPAATGADLDIVVLVDFISGS